MIYMLLSLLQSGESVFERWGREIKEAVENADPIEVWAIVIIIIGIFFALMLIFFTEFKRKERDSMKFTVIMIILASACLGIGIHMLMVSYGLW